MIALAGDAIEITLRRKEAEELECRIEQRRAEMEALETRAREAEERARAVTAFLERQGIDPARMQAIGYGKTRPAADNDTAEGRQKNRRVEIVVARGEIGE